MRLDKRKYHEASPLKVVWPQNPAGTAPTRLSIILAEASICLVFYYRNCSLALHIIIKLVKIIERQFVDIKLNSL